MPLLPPARRWVLVACGVAQGLPCCGAAIDRCCRKRPRRTRRLTAGRRTGGLDTAVESGCRWDDGLAVAAQRSAAQRRERDGWIAVSIVVGGWGRRRRPVWDTATSTAGRSRKPPPHHSTPLDSIHHVTDDIDATRARASLTPNSPLIQSFRSTQKRCRLVPTRTAGLPVSRCAAVPMTYVHVAPPHLPNQTCRPPHPQRMRPLAAWLPWLEPALHCTALQGL